MSEGKEISMEWLPALNPDQLVAVEHTEGYVRLIAGAGSGKTRTLASRFAYLVNELGILPSSILCVTFTNKSASEMRSRIHALIGDEDTGYISTFHSFCSTVLKEEANVIHFPKSFMVLDNADIDSMLKTVYEQRGLTSRSMTFAKARDMIEIRKIDRTPDYYLDLISLPLEQLYEKYLKARQPEDIIFYGYLYQQKKNFGLDYNDLIILTLHIFDADAQIAQKWQEKLEYIMIDEFQDIDALQYRLMKVLSAWHKNLFVVGDPDQTIYSWRGANVRYLLDFDQNFPGTETFFLNTNYRSTPQILNAANHLISANANRIRKNLQAVRPDGVPVRAMHFLDSAKEAQGVAQLISHLIHKGYEYRDIAILYRAHYLSRNLEDEFLKNEIPYTIYSGVPFFQRMEIKDALAYLRMLIWQDDIDFRRTVNTPKRNIGASRMKFLEEQAAASQKSLWQTLKDSLDHDLFRNTQAAAYVELIDQFPYREMPVTEVLSRLLDQSGYEAMLRLQGAQERLDNLAELKQSVSEFERNSGEEGDLEQYLNHIALYTAADQDMLSQKVKMMTIHTAKGLEFPAVILIGMSENVFPSRKTRSLEQMEEERRLAFVALTRARNELCLTDAEGAAVTGGYRCPSRFLLDIGEQAMIWDPRPAEDLLAHTMQSVNSRIALKRPLKESEILNPGDRVRHKVFGEGTVMETDLEKLSYLIHFDGLDTVRRLSVKAQLEKTGESGQSMGLS